ncbi:hypothetical protein GCM10025857_21860 [Alicyclobacillus contaminans]|nr:hypothetical protein GCM10025857_21860 [Alicyclobacillus contaminans]
MHSESWIAQIRSLRPRAQQIFQELMQRSEPVTTEELARRYQRSDRSIRYDLEALATACEAMPVRLVHRRSGVWLEDTPEAKLTLRHQWSAVQGTVQMAAADRRLHRLLAVLLTTPEPIVVKQVQDWLEASLRTIYADMDRADLWLASHGLRLIRKPHYGAKVEGDELIRRQAAFRLLLAACGWTASNDAGNEGQRLLDIVRQHVDPFVKRRLLEESDLLAMARALRWNPASEMRFGSWWAKVALYGAVTCQRIRLGYPVDLFKPNVNALRETTEFSFAVQVAERLEQMLSLTWSEEEVIALALHMLGAYPNLHLEGSAQNTANLDDFSRNWVSRMLAAVDDALGMRLGADEELFRGLAFHVKPMIHRWLLGISIENDLLDEIREDHALAYYAAVVAAQFLERVFGQPLAAAEVGYMALHFGAALERRWARPKGAVGTVRALVVCAGGLAPARFCSPASEPASPTFRWWMCSTRAGCIKRQLVRWT